MKMRKTDVSTMLLRRVVDHMPDTFRTKRLSAHPDIQKALRRFTDYPRFHQIIGMRLSESADQIGIYCIDRSPNATWQKTNSSTQPRPGEDDLGQNVRVEAPRPVNGELDPEPRPQHGTPKQAHFATPDLAEALDDVFLNENLNHPENRINVALFGLMTQDWLREWILHRLGLPTEAVVYPPVNDSGVRPDLKVVDYDGQVLAWIEVELGTNAAQVAEYRSRLGGPVKTIWGQQDHGGDLSLEEIADHLAAQKDLPPQARLNVRHLHDQIRQGLAGFTASSVRAEVSDEMREHPVVAGLVDRLADRLLFTTGTVPAGYLKADTNKAQGFSLRVNSRVSTSGTLSVLAISGGRPSVIVPARAKLDRYLPGHKAEVAAYAALLDHLGCDIGNYEENQRPSLPVDIMVEALDDVGNCVLSLADQPRR